MTMVQLKVSMSVGKRVLQLVGKKAASKVFLMATSTAVEKVE